VGAGGLGLEEGVVDARRQRRALRGAERAGRRRAADALAHLAHQSFDIVVHGVQVPWLAFALEVVNALGRCYIAAAKGWCRWMIQFVPSPRAWPTKPMS